MSPSTAYVRSALIAFLGQMMRFLRKPGGKSFWKMLKGQRGFILFCGGSGGCGSLRRGESNRTISSARGI